MNTSFGSLQAIEYGYIYFSWSYFVVSAGYFWCLLFNRIGKTMRRIQDDTSFAV
ncbi:hypothetical protein HMPREF1250_0659 [Megasphaera vaginalis (ex Srinivasan et al. 2021)]|uniref:Uncharacterized protein n=1 Tax=Megasphaera vaginalis (ex Srinivasan et al. 2021) TaxID=1111454 RepID=U7UEY1_9FIRM|nr:hypothetical protein HMPREF1250_0659 [Megasphaera vaginalis (ex Srinivasan et al. 2021)]